MKTTYVICYLERQPTGHMGSVVAFDTFDVDDWVNEKLNIGDRNIPEFSTPDEAILWYDELRIKVKLATDKFNESYKSKHGFFSIDNTIGYDLGDEIYLIQKVKF